MPEMLKLCDWCWTTEQTPISAVNMYERGGTAAYDLFVKHIILRLWPCYSMLGRRWMPRNGPHMTRRRHSCGLPTSSLLSGIFWLNEELIWTYEMSLVARLSIELSTTHIKTLQRAWFRWAFHQFVSACAYFVAMKDHSNIVGEGWGLSVYGGGQLQRVGGSFNLLFCLNKPIFSYLGLCATCWSHFMCHHELWPTSMCRPFPSLNSSLGLPGGKYYQKITIPIFRLILQNFLFLGCFYTRQIMSKLGQRKQISNKKGSLVN